MPDANGWPTPQECIKKLNLAAPDPVEAALIAEVTPILAGVIAHFQSPKGPEGKGGTGRCFTPVQKTKVFNGNGYSRLVVDDIVPDTALSVSVYGTPLPNVLLEEKGPGLGHYTLVIPYSGNYQDGWNGWFATFPIGQQNISVAATWGFAAQVPADIYEAIRCETAYKALVTGVVGINGVGQEIQGDGFEVSTAVGAMNWPVSSPVGVFHNTYLDCVDQYRLSDEKKRKSLVMRMS